MKRTSLTTSVAITSVITLILMFGFSSNLLQQLLFLLGGIFATLVIAVIGIAVGVTDKAPEPAPAKQPEEMSPEMLAKVVRRMRDAYMDDVTIARSLVININTIKAIK